MLQHRLNILLDLHKLNETSTGKYTVILECVITFFYRFKLNCSDIAVKI